MLELKITTGVASGCEEFTVLDSTGNYDATFNTTGWGSPNQTLAAIVTTQITVTYPDSTTTYVVNTGSLSKNASGAWIIPFEDIVASTGSSIADGVYTIQWDVNFGTENYTTSCKLFVYCTTKCAVFSLLGDLAVSQTQDCGCELEEQIEDALTAWSYFQALMYAACCGQDSNFTKLIEIIKDLTESSPCKSC